MGPDLNFDGTELNFDRAKIYFSSTKSGFLFQIDYIFIWALNATKPVFGVQRLCY